MSDPAHAISLAHLVLARLLPPGSKGETPGKIRDDLYPLAGKTQGKSALLARVKERLAQLQSSGQVEHVSPKRSACVLTPEGRKQICGFLGIDKVPARITWATVRDTYLFAKTMGIDPAYLKKRGLDGVRAVALARMLDLPWRSSSTVTSVIDSGLARHFELARKPRYALRPEMVARAVIIGEEDAAAEQDASGGGTAVAGAGRAGAGEEDSGRIGAEEKAIEESAEGGLKQGVDLGAFAREVHSAAGDCRTGWFGTDKVFISHVWQAYAGNPARLVNTMASFKRCLVAAHRKDLLTLVRADLVEAMDPGDVAVSETRYLSATFHFVRYRRDK